MRDFGHGRLNLIGLLNGKTNQIYGGNLVKKVRLTRNYKAVRKVDLQKTLAISCYLREDIESGVENPKVFKAVGFTKLGYIKAVDSDDNEFIFNSRQICQKK